MQIWNNGKTMNIVSFGEIVWDVHGEDHRLGGAPLNFAVHAAALGNKAWIVSAVGKDALGDAAVERAKRFHLQTEYIARAPLGTAKCVVTFSRDGYPHYTHDEIAAFDRIPLPDIRFPVDALAFGTFALRKESNREVLQQLLRTVSCRHIFTDLNLRAPYYTKETVELCLCTASICKISEEELPAVCACALGTYSYAEDAARRLCARYKNIHVLLVTLGEKGAFCFDARTNSFFRCVATPTVAVSTVGAGDAFSAAFLSHYLRGYPIDACLALAADVSAVVCGSADAFSEETEKKIRQLQTRRS